MHIAIIGAEAAKFTTDTRFKAQATIHQIITHWQHRGITPTIVSGHCHLGGVDIWAEEVAEDLECPTLIFPPSEQSWEYGYKPRNIKIASAADIVHVIGVRKLPATYTGMTFKACYHCQRRKDPDLTHAHGFEISHVKSGACWTAWYAVEHCGADATWHVITESTLKGDYPIETGQEKQSNGTTE